MSDPVEPTLAPHTSRSEPPADAALEKTLRSLGYDVESPRAGDPQLGTLVARRDQGDRAVLFTADAGGRFRAEITWRVGEWPSNLDIGGVPARIVDGVTRSISVAGQTAGEQQLIDVLAGLEAVLPWADTAAEEGLHSGEHRSSQ